MGTVLLEARPYRPFKSGEEYLLAMKEDLAEWLQTMYPSLDINVDNFMEKLETGVVLCEVSFKGMCGLNLALFWVSMWWPKIR